MVRLSDLTPGERGHLLDKHCPTFETAPFVTGKPLHARRVSLITTAGLQTRADEAFDFRDVAYRVIPGDVDSNDIVMSHQSVNFDRTGFQQDLNVVFPIDRFRERERDGRIGSLGRFHYSFMGAYSDPLHYKASARDVAKHLKGDGVDTVFLTPI